MSLRDEMIKYEQITGESAEHVPIIKLGAFLDGYEKAIEDLTKDNQKKRDTIYMYGYKDGYLQGANDTHKLYRKEEKNES